MQGKTNNGWKRTAVSRKKTNNKNRMIGEKETFKYMGILEAETIKKCR